MTTFSVGIPTLNRIDLLLPSLQLYVKDFPDVQIFIVDNGKQQIPNFHKNINIIRLPENVGVGASWNLLCKACFLKSENSLILNDDIYLGKSKSQIEELIKKKPNTFLTATPDWCAFILPKNIYEKVGDFDECFFPAYYEDNSYAYRMKLLNVAKLSTPYLNPLTYQVSKSIEKDSSIFNYRKKNKDLYVSMWGGLPEREKFKKPFNI